MLPQWNCYAGGWSARLRLKDTRVLRPFIQREAEEGKTDAEVWHLFYPGQDDLICYRCLQSGHNGRLCKRNALYSDRVKGKGGSNSSQQVVKLVKK